MGLRGSWLQEYKSSDLLKKELSEEGFTIKSNIANIPTAFVAEYGEGSARHSYLRRI